MTKRSRTLGRWALLAAFVFLLTGCLKLDMQLDVQADDTVNGSVVFAVNKDVLSLTGGSFEDLIGDQGVPFPSDIEGVTTEEYDDGEFVGQQYTFEGVALGEFNSDPADPDGLRITHEGDTFVVDGVLDLSQGLEGLSGVTGATGPFDPSQMMGSAQLRIAISFPGDVTDSNGEIDGNTVVWQPKFGERQELQATASAVESGGDNWTLVFILLGVAAVAIIAAIVVLMNRRKKAAEASMAPTVAEPAPMGTPSGEATAPMPPASMPPDAPESAPATAPPTPPTPPPPPAGPTMPPEPTMPPTEPAPPPSEADTVSTEPDEEPPPAGQA